MKYITFNNGVFTLFTVGPVHKKFFFPGLSPFEYIKKGFRYISIEGDQSVQMVFFYSFFSSSLFSKLMVLSMCICQRQSSIVTTNYFFFPFKS